MCLLRDVDVRECCRVVVTWRDSGLPWWRCVTDLLLWRWGLCVYVLAPAQAEAQANRARRDAYWAQKRQDALLHNQTKTVSSERAKAKLLAIAKTYEDLHSTLGSNVCSKCVAGTPPPPPHSLRLAKLPPYRAAANC